MSAAAFTPAPLVVDECAGGYTLTATSVGEGYFGHVGVAVQRNAHPTFGGGIPDATAHANAVLWAAAPALVDAMEQAIVRINDEAPEAAATILEAALLAARGEP